MDEYLLYQMMNGRGTLGGISVNVVFLAGLLLALLWKPDRIRSVTLFRWACTFMVMATFLPILANVFFGWYSSVGPGFGRRSPNTPFNSVLLTIGPVTAGIGMFCGFAALMPPGKPKKGRAEPQITRHPLD